MLFYFSSDVSDCGLFRMLIGYFFFFFKYEFFSNGWYFLIRLKVVKNDGDDEIDVL